VIWEIATYALQPYAGKSNEELLSFVTTGGSLVIPDGCEDLMKQLMELCWQNDPKLRPQFLEAVRILDDELSEDFQTKSFYHEMKRKLIEENCLTEEGELLIGRPGSSRGSSKKGGRSGSGGKARGGSMSSADSGSYVKNSKPEADQTPDTGSKNRTNRPLIKEEEVDKEDVSVASDRLLSSDSLPQQSSQNSDTITSTLGDSPVHNSSSDDDEDEDKRALRVSKIFFGKAVPV